MVAEDRIAALEERVARLEEHPPARRRSWWEDDDHPRSEYSSAARRAAAVQAGAGAAAAPHAGPEYVAVPHAAGGVGHASGQAGPEHVSVPHSGPAPYRGAAPDAAAGRSQAPPAVGPPAWARGAAAMSGRTPAAFIPVRPVPPKLSPAAPKRDFEDFVGGSLLAWLGGIAVLAGLAFLLTIAVSRGWIGEGARTALAGVLSAGLLGAGVWLRERKGQTEASLAAAAVGVAGLFGTLVVAGPVYHLVPVALAFVAAFATGAFATTLAIRWRAQVMGWLGLLGALLAPTALSAVDAGGMVFLAIAFAATIGVVISQRWAVLGAVAYLVTTVQWLAFALGDHSPALTLIAFGALTIVYGLGLEANRRGAHPVVIGPRARAFTHLGAVGVLAINATILAAAGYSLLDGEPWLAGLAVAYIALGIALTHVDRITRELALIVLSIGVVLANIAFASIAGGLPLVIGWAVSALPFAAILGARSGQSGPFTKLVDAVIGTAEGESARRADRILAMAGLLGQISLSAFQGIAFDAPVELLNGPFASSTALAAAGAIAVVTWACGRLVGERYRMWLDTLALTAVAHFTGLALEGAALAATLAAEALALAGLARRTGDLYTAWAAVGFAMLSLLHALGTLATPDALFVGLDAPLAAAGALAAAAAALLVVSRVPLGLANGRRIFETAGVVALVYLTSVEVVTLAGPTHTGQTLLSVLWAFAGVGALIRGLLIDDRELRRAALVFLAVTVCKVFFYDLASLDSLYRVGSLVGLGLLLLCGAFAWQQVRPNEAKAS